MIIDPYSLARSASLPESRTFVDSFHPDIVIEVTLTPVTGFNDRIRKDEEYEELLSNWVTGKIPTEGGQKEPPAPLVIHGKVFKPTETLAFYIHEIVSMCVTVAGESKSDFMYWCAMSEAFPNAFTQICRWVDEIRRQSAAALKNEPRADTAPSSDLP